MKKFKLVYWSDCRGMEVNGVSVEKFKDGRDVLECLKNRREDWVNMFVIGDLDKEVFEIDFGNELNSCVVVREDSELFDKEWDCDLINSLI